jgi:hypothetical protein
MFVDDEPRTAPTPEGSNVRSNNSRAAAIFHLPVRGGGGACYKHFTPYGVRVNCRRILQTFNQSVLLARFQRADL